MYIPIPTVSHEEIINVLEDFYKNHRINSDHSSPHEVSSLNNHYTYDSVHDTHSPTEHSQFIPVSDRSRIDNRNSAFVSTTGRDKSPYSSNGTFPETTPFNHNHKYSEEKSLAASDRILKDTPIKTNRPSLTCFEDMKSSAMQNWTSGVDFEMQSKEITRAKQTPWLTASEFNNLSSPKEAISILPPSEVTPPTYAKVTSQKPPADPPAWILYNEHSSEPTNTVFSTPQSIISYETEFEKIPVEENVSLFIFAYSIQRQLFGEHTLSRFQERIEDMIQLVHSMDYRTLGMFIQALCFAVELERAELKLTTEPYAANEPSFREDLPKTRVSDALVTHYPIFLEAIETYIQTYIASPEEVISLLKFFLNFAVQCPVCVDSIPLGAINIQFNEKKSIFLENEIQQVNGLLREISSLQKRDIWFNINDESSHDHPSDMMGPEGISAYWIEEWRSLKEHSLKLFTGSMLAEEVLDRLNSKNETIYPMWYPEGVKTNVVGNSDMASIVNTSWLSSSLDIYLSVHYAILRELLWGPVRQALKCYVTQQNPSTENIYWSVIHELQVYSTSLSASVITPTIVFESLINKAVGTSDPVSIQEGSLAVLIPSTHKLPHDLASLASLSSHIITGTVSSFISQPVSNDTLDTLYMLSLHIEQEEIKKLRRSSGYTMIATSMKGAPMLPILSWLRKEATQFDKRMFSTPVLDRLLTVTHNSPADSSSNNQKQPKENQREIDENHTVPLYLQNSEIDISCIVTEAFANSKARPGQGVWPQLPSKYMSMPIHSRPDIYTLSHSQLSAGKHALYNRVAVISGSTGTGKTYLASKVGVLTHQALVTSQVFHPILLLTKNEATLEEILENVVDEIPHLIHLGISTNNKKLIPREGYKLFGMDSKDQNRRYILQMERHQATLQANLKALWDYRFRIQNSDFHTLMTIIPPDYMYHLRQVIHKKPYNVSLKNNERIVRAWLYDTQPSQNNVSDSLPLTKDFELWNTAYTALLESLSPPDTYKRTSHLTDPSAYSDKLSWIQNHRPHIYSIEEATNWPLSTSPSASHIRTALYNIWSRKPPEYIWFISVEERREIWVNAVRTVLRFIDQDIDRHLEEQLKLSEALDAFRLQRWGAECCLSRFIGMTMEFATVHQEFVRSLCPSIVIVDEASEILESSLIPFIFGPRMEHLILFGDDKHMLNSQALDALSDSPRGLDVSLFERWTMTGGKVLQLKEQWRMCSEINEIHSVLSPVLLEEENKIDSTVPPLSGLDNRTYFVSMDTEITCEYTDNELSNKFGEKIYESMSDEARYVCRLALYYLQQSQEPIDASILVLDPVQKRLIQWLIMNEMKNYSRLSKAPLLLTVLLVEECGIQERDIVFFSLCMSKNSKASEEQISFALSRARYGLYFVGDTSALVGTPWKKIIHYMKLKGICSPNLQLRCMKHKDRTTIVTYWQDFNKVVNGGCALPCETLMKCGHVCQESCHILDHSRIPCTNKCVRPRPEGCPHACPNSCHVCEKQKRACPPCTELVCFEPPCGHERLVECYTVILDNMDNARRFMEEQLTKIGEVADNIGRNFQIVCTERCSRPLSCGHACPNLCGAEHSHDAIECKASCTKQLICGHYCAEGCAQPNEHTERCLEPCQQVCSHRYKCGRDCWEVCTPCNESCPYSCAHGKCNKRCHEKCDRPPCNESCKEILPCSHLCIGLCGEECPPCRVCYPDIKCSISLRILGEFESDERSYVLPECKCVFSVEFLDMYFENQAKNGEHNAIKLWLCPLCQTPIYTALRYNMYIKTEIALVNKIKAQQNAKAQLITPNEKRDIIEAMNSEIHSGIHNIVGGRWFVCENEHPYFIGDCGGATQIANCPQCGAIIGGLQHKVVESNRFYGEFDGSHHPAWPGQSIS
ncbi:hypothetical protein BDF14DRAFT_1994603 [Spinellus fusiger]|nr:hypothetical protein BDF14DRAFT_1994603 [Spinellus fusiger]